MSGVSFITTLEVLVWQVHFYLRPCESVCHERVCREWKRILSSDGFWKNVCVIQELAFIADFSHRQTATILRAEARLNRLVHNVERRQCSDETGKLDEPAVSITIDNFSEKREPTSTRGWIPLKYLLNRSGGYKTQGDQILVTYEERNLLLTLCKENGSKDFCDSLNDKVENGVGCGEVDIHHVEFVKKLAEQLTSKAIIST